MHGRSAQRSEMAMQVVYVVGSFRDLETSRAVAQRFGDLGFTALLSLPGDPRGIDGCLDRVARSDFVYVSNPRGEVGKGVSLDIGYALGLGKPVYASRPVEDPPIGHRIEVADVEDLARQVRVGGK
ncbi:MAG: hypothetical protein QM765_41645 [Myxococcales bacterium]